LITNIEDPNYNSYKRTFLLEDGKVVYKIIRKTGLQAIPTWNTDYSDLLLDKYISVIEIVDPMHRMWSDGRGINSRWHTGCYGGNVPCDIVGLHQIYEPIAANLLCDRMEEMMEQTREKRFSYVEAWRLRH
jgi:hypothetical protein